MKRQKDKKIKRQKAKKTKRQKDNKTKRQEGKKAKRQKDKKTKRQENKKTKDKGTLFEISILEVITDKTEEGAFSKLSKPNFSEILVWKWAMPGRGR